MELIPSAVLDRPVSGVNLMPGTLRDQVGEARTLLVFLRHFGCIFCKETVQELREVTEADPGYPPVLFFFLDSPLEGKVFLRHAWPTARAVSDEEKFFYSAFGLRRGGVVAMFGPGVWSAHGRAAAKGHASGPRSGDVFQMPGIFLIEDDRILWQHEFSHAADHPDFARIPALAEAAEAAGAIDGPGGPA